MLWLHVQLGGIAMGSTGQGPGRRPACLMYFYCLSERTFRSIWDLAAKQGACQLLPALNDRFYSAPSSAALPLAASAGGMLCSWPPCSVQLSQLTGSKFNFSDRHSERTQQRSIAVDSACQGAGRLPAGVLAKAVPPLNAGAAQASLAQDQA